MQNYPLKITQITYVMVSNALKLPGPPAVRAFILWMSTFVTKLNLYPKNGCC